MNEMQVFENPTFGPLRTMEQNDEPWFVAADVCKALEIGNPTQALSRLDDDEKFTTLISNESAASGKSHMSFVNEPGLYTLVLGSRKPEAKAFKRWVTHDVLPALRKRGTYSIGGEAQTTIKLLQTLESMDLLLKVLAVAMQPHVKSPSMQEVPEYEVCPLNRNRAAISFKRDWLGIHPGPEVVEILSRPDKDHYRVRYLNEDTGGYEEEVVHNNFIRPYSKDWKKARI